MPEVPGDALELAAEFEAKGAEPVHGGQFALEAVDEVDKVAMELVLPCRKMFSAISCLTILFAQVRKTV